MTSVSVDAESFVEELRDHLTPGHEYFLSSYKNESFRHQISKDFHFIGDFDGHLMWAMPPRMQRIEINLLSASDAYDYRESIAKFDQDKPREEQLVRSYEILLPWQVFLLTKSSQKICLFFANYYGPLDLNSRMSLPPFPNVFDVYGNLCLGYTKSIGSSKYDIHSLVDQSNLLWSTCFNFDVSYVLRATVNFYAFMFMANASSFTNNLKRDIESYYNFYSHKTQDKIPVEDVRSSLPKLETPSQPNFYSTHYLDIHGFSSHPNFGSFENALQIDDILAYCVNVLKLHCRSVDSRNHIVFAREDRRYNDQNLFQINSIFSSYSPLSAPKIRLRDCFAQESIAGNLESINAYFGFYEMWEKRSSIFKDAVLSSSAKNHPSTQPMYFLPAAPINPRYAYNPVSPQYFTLFCNNSENELHNLHLPFRDIVTRQGYSLVLSSTRADINELSIALNRVWSIIPNVTFIQKIESIEQEIRKPHSGLLSSPIIANQLPRKLDAFALTDRIIFKKNKNKNSKDLLGRSRSLPSIPTGSRRCNFTDI